jgi:hypothetical protein
MAAEPVSGQELRVLHERISSTVQALGTRFRRKPALSPRMPDEIFRLAEEAVHHLRLTPRLAMGVGALVAVAVVAAVLATRARRP